LISRWDFVGFGSFAFTVGNLGYDGFNFLDDLHTPGNAADAVSSLPA
jgi:hypothetical protein